MIVYKIIVFLLNKTGLNKLINDKAYIQLRYKSYFKDKINFKKPLTFNEKIQWLKLNDRISIKQTMTDKESAKVIASKIFGEEYIIPTIGIWKSFEDIPFEDLPESFVIKCTHDSGSTKIITNKALVNYKKLKKFFDKKLKQNHFLKTREYNYKNIKPQIIIEPLIDKNPLTIYDYKFFCFNGKCKYVQVDFNRFSKHTRNIYDENFNLTNNKIKIENNSEIVLEINDKHYEMIKLAEKASIGFKHIRIDFYLVNNKIYFGEFTFHHGGGFEKFIPNEFSIELGSYINIDN